VSEKESPAAEHLNIYLNDHLAGSVAAIELLDSLIEQHSEDRFGAILRDLRDDIHDDQETLRDLMRKVGAAESSVRKAGAWLVEKLSRIKIGDADDSAGLLQALEGLALGITGKELLWRSLTAIASTFPPLQGTDFSALAKRAQDQFTHAENLRMQMVRETFGR
jgi:hypothetical protein